MSLLYIDGFDDYSESQASERGWVFYTAVTAWSSSYSRFGIGQGVRIDNSTSGSYVLKRNIGVDKTTIYFGMAVKKVEAGIPTLNTSYPLVLLEDGSLVNQVKICVNSDYGLNVYQGDNTLLGSSSDGVISELSWFYLEVKVTISDAVGEVTVRVDEDVVLNLTSQDTRNGDEYIRYIGFMAVNRDYNTYFDDFYIDDSQFHGDCRVRTFMPDSNGYTDFTPSTGSNYENVDEVTGDDDTTYNEGSDEGDKDSYGITSEINGPVVGVQLANYARKTGDLVVKTKDIVKSGGTDYQGTEEKNQSTDYGYTVSMWQNDPDTSNPWTQAGLDAAEFGIEVTAMSTTTTV